MGANGNVRRGSYAFCGRGAVSRNGPLEVLRREEEAGEQQGSRTPNVWKQGQYVGMESLGVAKNLAKGGITGCKVCLMTWTGYP